MLDVAFHWGSAIGLPSAVAAWLGPDGEHAHLVTLVGMVVTVVALAIRGIRVHESGAGDRETGALRPR